MSLILILNSNPGIQNLNPLALCFFLINWENEDFVINQMIFFPVMKFKK